MNAFTNIQLPLIHSQCTTIINIFFFFAFPFILHIYPHKENNPLNKQIFGSQYNFNLCVLYKIPVTGKKKKNHTLTHQY